MTSATEKFPPVKATVIDLAVDMLLSLIAGAATSVLMFVGYTSAFGQHAALSDLIGIFRFLFSSQDPRDTPIRWMAIFPVVTTVLTILITRGLVQKTASRKGWIPAAFFVAVTSTIILLALQILIFFKDGYARSLAENIVGLLPFGAFFVLLGFLTGSLLGAIFAPRRRVLKIVVAVIASALVAGVYELIGIYAISTS